MQEIELSDSMDDDLEDDIAIEMGEMKTIREGFDLDENGFTPEEPELDDYSDGDDMDDMEDDGEAPALLDDFMSDDDDRLE